MMTDLVIVLFNDGTRYQTEVIPTHPRSWVDRMASIGDDVQRLRETHNGVHGFVYISGYEVSSYNANEAAEILFGEDL